MFLKPLFETTIDRVLFSNQAQHSLVLNYLYIDTSPNSPRQGYIHHMSLLLYTNPLDDKEKLLILLFC